MEGFFCGGGGGGGGMERYATDHSPFIKSEHLSSNQYCTQRPHSISRRLFYFPLLFQDLQYLSFSAALFSSITSPVASPQLLC